MKVAEKKQVKDGRIKPGDLLVVAGSIGQTGARRLLEEKREWFTSRFSPGYVESILQENEKGFLGEEGISQEIAETYGITGWQAAGEGGIFKAIWDLSGNGGVGVSFELRRIPVKQYVIEICELCGANPYALWCGNCFVLAAQRGWQLAQHFKEQGMEAEVIGAAEDGIARKICHGEEGMGYLERPKEDELYRLLRSMDEKE